MSANTKSAEARDTSTDNANWGTLVIVLVLVIAAVVIGVVMSSNNHTPAPTNISAPASATP